MFSTTSLCNTTQWYKTDFWSTLFTNKFRGLWWQVLHTGGHFGKSILCDSKLHQKSRYLKKTLGQTKESVEWLYIFKTLNIPIFDGDWRHTKFPLNLPKFGRLSNFVFYCFWNSDSIGEWSAMCFIQMISVEEHSDKPNEYFFRNVLACL